MVRHRHTIPFFPWNSLPQLPGKSARRPSTKARNVPSR
nr:MAG TPA: hypothetical protein [Caudoviricetes sp.]